MSEVNPYAAPLGESVLEAHVEPTGGVWREATELVMLKGAVLPDRCVRCNAPANGRRLVRKLYWHHPIIWLIALASPLIYIIVALVVRKKAVVAIGLCDRHYALRRRAVIAWWLISLACVGLFVFGLQTADQNPLPILASIIIFLGNLLFAVAISRPVKPSLIDDRYVWLKKIHPDYLEQLPWLPQEPR